MPNFHTAFTSDADWTTGDVNPPLAEIDRGLTYIKNVIVHCEGDITWDAGTLTWSDDIHIHYNRTDGKAIHNSIAAGSQAVADNEFLYVTLNETDDTVLTEAVAAITTGAASNFIAYNVLVLGYRNATSDDFYGVSLRKAWTDLPATTTESGEVELATGAETATGTDTTRAVTPDGLATATKENSLARLATVTINGQTLTKQTIYTVPAGKKMVPVALVPREPSATLAGLTDMDVGGNANADDWIQQITLDAFTATTDYGEIRQPDQAAGPPIVPAKKTIYAAETVFGVKINTGSTGAATFSIDLFGYLA